MTKQSIHQLTLPTPYDVGDVHAYIIKGETITLIDAGVNTKEAWESFCDQLKELQLTPKDIDQVLLTHHHPDHTGFIGHLDHVHKILGHELTQIWLTRDPNYFNHYINFFNELYVKWGVPEAFHHIEKTLQITFKYSTTSELTDVLKEGDLVPGLDSFITLETPGHAESHLSFYNDRTQEFIAGDFLLKHISSNPLLEAPVNPEDERPKPLLAYRQSMEKILKYDFSNIYPGHGEIFSKHHALIKERFVQQEKRAKRVLDFIHKGPATPFEVCQFLFSKQYKKQFGLTMSETVGQLDYLLDVGLIKESIDDRGVVQFTVNHAMSNC